ncbi:tyrosine--tRNA ligase [Candidatus Microgenomates bacterium]|nr:tyrosine--tRNA ligase [Candidatus Microgenomates bacterium]
MDKIDELLTRGVENIYPSKKELETLLRSGKKIRLYLGIDPSGARLHVGHMAVLRKLRQFQDLGHKVILLVADFTGMIGDPTGKAGERKMLTHKQVMENAKTYKEQAGRVIRFSGENSVEIKNNSTWLSSLTFKEIIELAGNFTVQQMIERDMFQKRLSDQKPIGLHEFLYPLMQGYDSVAMDVDLEVGGADQTFNMLCGRTLLKNLKNKNKFVLAVPLIADKNGVKIGKTEGNVIALTANPEEFFALVMTLPDEVLINCFESLTDLPTTEIIKIAQHLKQGQNPIEVKKYLAFTLTRMLNSEKDAQKAQKEFEKVVQGGELPSEIQGIRLSAKEEIAWADFLVKYNLAKSKSDAKRLIEQGGVEIGGERVGDPKEILIPENNAVIKVGKKNFVKLIVE